MVAPRQRWEFAKQESYQQKPTRVSKTIPGKKREQGKKETGQKGNRAKREQGKEGAGQRGGSTKSEDGIKTNTGIENNTQYTKRTHPTPTPDRTTPPNKHGYRKRYPTDKKDAPTLT